MGYGSRYILGIDDTIFTLCKNYRTAEELVLYIKNSPNFPTELFNFP